jgi:hypothetical protein
MDKNNRREARVLLPERPHFIHLMPTVDTVQVPQKVDNHQLVAVQDRFKGIAGQTTPRNADRSIKLEYR